MAKRRKKAVAGAGERNQRITIQKKSIDRNELGEEVVSWVDVLQGCYAAIDFNSAGTGESFEDDQKTAAESVSFTIPYRGGLTEEMRVLWSKRLYDIIRIDRSGISMRQQIKITAVFMDGKNEI